MKIKHLRKKQNPIRVKGKKDFLLLFGFIYVNMQLFSKEF